MSLISFSWNDPETDTNKLFGVNGSVSNMIENNKYSLSWPAIIREIFDFDF